MRWSMVSPITLPTDRLKALTALRMIFGYGGAVRIARDAPGTWLLDLI